MPIIPPIVLFTISAGVGVLEDKNICKTSTSDDNAVLISVTIKNLLKKFSFFLCKTAVELKPKGINNKMLFTKSSKELLLSKLAIIYCREKVFGKEKLNGYSVAINTAEALRITKVKFFMGINL
ncbi:hypothetical protein CAL7716_042330 [Calothrix sp. PCC 7716]|nr:hypothetical protein CAL7716_042330 [Calothrix sp. PCC 7716]